MNHLAFDEIGSTSDEARRLAEAGEPGPLWISARRQTAGRGRRGRPWVSEPGNLYATLLFRPPIPIAAAGQYSFVAAVALANAIAAPQLALKWPNDVLIERRKIAGILLESRGRPDGSLEWLSIGIGVNITQAPESTETPAASLREFALSRDPEALLKDLAAQFDALDGLYRMQGFGPIRAAWLERVAGLGRPIQVRLHDRTLSGLFAALDETGALVLDQDGVTTLIAAGEVFLES